MQFFNTQMLFPYVDIIYYGYIFLSTKIFESWISIDTLLVNVSFVLSINNIRERKSKIVCACMNYQSIRIGL